MNDKRSCKDFKGNIVVEGDEVEVFSLIGCKEKIGNGVVWVIGDMNEKQTSMPYIRIDGRNMGAWHPNAILKVMEENDG